MGYRFSKIRLMLGQKSEYILASSRKLGIILENKVLQKLIFLCPWFLIRKDIWYVSN